MELLTKPAAGLFLGRGHWFYPNPSFYKELKSTISQTKSHSKGNVCLLFLETKAEKKKRQRIDFLEKQIAKDESRMKAIEAVLSAPDEGDDIMELTRSYLECKRDLDAKTDEWGSLIE